MQRIRVNNKFFRSIAEAARFLHISKPYLHAKMQNKKAITYKDLLIEKVETQKPVKKIKPRKRGIPVLVDGKYYNNCAEAERAIGAASSTISDALRRGAPMVLGHTVEALMPSMIKKYPNKKDTRRNGTKVECITTGVVYKSINEAAAAANCDSWTMSKKMETSGGFVDAFGNEYRRLSPMATKNNYEDTGKTVQFKKSYAHRAPNKGFVTIDESLLMAQKTGEPLFPTVDFPKPLDKAPVKEQKTEVPQIVKDAINDKIIALLKEKGVYDDVIALLEYGGFTSVKFNTNKND